MPIRVPRSQGGQVQSTQMPRARVNTSAPSGAFGDPVGQVAAKGIEQLAGGAQALIEEKIKVQTERARKAKLLNFDNQAAELEHGLQREALGRKGINAFGVHEEIDKKWSEFSEAQLQTFSDPDLRQAAEQVLSRRKISLSKVVESHAQKESDNVFVGELSAGIENNIKLASLNFTDPQEIAKNLNDAEDKAVELSAFYGHDKEQREQFILKATSPIHESVIDAKMRSGDISGAKQYLLENELGLDNKTRESLASVVDKAHDAFIADNLSVEGVSKYATAPNGRQMFQAFLDGKETDPDIKKTAMSRFNDRMALYEKDKKENRSRTYDLAKQIYNQQGIGALTTKHRKLWETLDPDDRKTLMGTHNTLIKGLDRETDLIEKAKVLAIPPQAMAALDAFEIEKMVKNFSNSDRTKILDKWSDAKSGSADSKFLTPLSKYQKFIALSYQAKFGKALDPKKKDHAEIILRIQDMVEQHEISTSKSATETDIRKKVQEAFSDRIVTEKGFLWDSNKTKMNVLLKPGEFGRIPTDQIPENDQANVRRFMEANGVAPAYLTSPEKISEVFTLIQSRDEQKLQQLLKTLRGGKAAGNRDPKGAASSSQSKANYQLDRALRKIRTVE